MCRVSLEGWGGLKSTKYVNVIIGVMNVRTMQRGQASTCPFLIAGFLATVLELEQIPCVTIFILSVSPASNLFEIYPPVTARRRWNTRPRYLPVSDEIHGSDVILCHEVCGQSCQRRCKKHVSWSCAWLERHRCWLFIKKRWWTYRNTKVVLGQVLDNKIKKSFQGENKANS